MNSKQSNLAASKTAHKHKDSRFHASVIAAMNRAGLTDMYGSFYTSDSYLVTSFILRKARAAAKRGEL